MKSHSKNPFYCNYSFDDLYKAAFGKKLKPTEKRNLQNLPQEEINRLVQQWADKSGWKTNLKKGTDNQLYLSFQP